MKDFAVGVNGCLETNAWRAVQLGYHDALGTINNKCALLSHEWQFTHVNFFLFGAPLVFVAESDIKSGAVGLTFALGLESRHFWLAEFVAYKIQ